jgi:hypothetical protein
MSAVVVGLDVHKDSTYATILNPEGKIVNQTRMNNERGPFVPVTLQRWQGCHGSFHSGSAVVQTVDEGRILRVCFSSQEDALHC